VGPEPSVKSPCGGSDDAVRSMTRSLRRRYSAALAGGRGSAEPLEIGAKALEPAKSLEAQPLGTPRRMGRGTYRGVAAGTGEALPGPVACGCCCRSVASYNR
jgi:hypothetical protein